MKAMRMVGLAMAVSTTAALAVPQLDQSNLGDVEARIFVGRDYIGQVITAGASGVLTTVEFSITKFDGFTFGDVTVQIREVTIEGEPGPTILGSKTFNNVLISPQTDDFTTFDLQSLDLTFSAGDMFAIVVTSPNNTGTTFPVDHTSDEYSRGGLYYSGDGVKWDPVGNDVATKDARFRTYVEDPVQVVGISIGAGSDLKCFNIDGHGVIPVAILGSDSFDVTDIDVESLSFGGVVVRVRGKKGPLCEVEYVDDDAYIDLVCLFEDDPENWSVGNEEATLLGDLLSGGSFTGADSICIVP